MKRFSLYLYNVVHGKKFSVFGFQFSDLIMKVGFQLSVFSYKLSELDKITENLNAQ